MRLIKQRKLHFKEGKSDKVYEVDLCEAGQGEFVVNFRYGRRGATLKDGTKTVFPVALAEAETVFDKLVASKIKKGYRDGDGGSVDVSHAEPVAVESAGDVPLPGNPEMRRKIIAHLVTAAAGRAPARWRLSRVIWRAGELRISEAVQPLSDLVGSSLCGDVMSRYCLAWAIGRCGGGGNSIAGAALERLIAAAGADEAATLRMANEALRVNDPGSIAAIEDALPDKIRQALVDGDIEGLRKQIRDVAGEAVPDLDFLHRLYLLADSHPMAREVVFEVAQSAPLRPPYFKSIRYLFKAAEFRLDAEFFGMLARRFENSNAFYRSSYYGGRVYIPELRSAFQPDTESKKHDSKLAYSSSTRSYLRQRVVRTMERAGLANDVEAFITLATGVLLAYDDDRDRRDPTSESSYFGGWVTSHYDEFASYNSFNFLLYLNGSRYQKKKNLSWICRTDYKPGDPAPEHREEAFPQLWDQAPDALMHLLRLSRCSRVIDFAIKVWRANESSFNELADVPFIRDLLGRPYENANRLGLDLARLRFDVANPDKELLQALLECPFEPARGVGLVWLGKCKQLLGEDIEFCAALITCCFADVQLETRRMLTASVLSDSQLEQLVPMVVGLLSELKGSDGGAAETARNARETLLIIAAAKLKTINPDVVVSLLGHEIEEVQLLGAHIALQFEDHADELSDAVLESMLLSDFTSVREIGMRLFGKLPDVELLKRQDILASFCISKKVDLRREAQPIVKRLAGIDRGFAEEIVQRFYPALLRKESHEGLHDDIYTLLEGSLGDHLHVIPADYAFRMVESRYVGAQRLGALIIKKFIDLKEYPMRQIAELGGGDLLELREHVAAFYRGHPDFIKVNKEDALRVLDNSWKDGRDAGFLFFRESFEEHDWTPSLLVSVCDSNRQDVQAFGRELITKFFKTEDGPEYLLKLSQHPTAELQAFATNYLERFAGGSLERIEGLELFFVTVLSMVNRGRVAKDRVLGFLHNQALESREVAVIVTRVLKRQSVTIAIGDKAACIRTLLAIQKAWPDLAAESPLVRHDFVTCEID